MNKEARKCIFSCNKIGCFQYFNYGFYHFYNIYRTFEYNLRALWKQRCRLGPNPDLNDFDLLNKLSYDACKLEYFRIKNVSSGKSDFGSLNFKCI